MDKIMTPQSEIRQAAEPSHKDGGPLNHLTISVLVFLVVFVGHFTSGNITSTDSRWTVYTAMSVIKEGDTDLDEYEDMLKTYNYIYTEKDIRPHLYYIYPIGVSVIAVPFVFVIDQVLVRMVGFDLEGYIKHTIPGGVEAFIASFIVGLTAIFVYSIARLSLDRRYSLLLVFIFAFGTSAWSTASRALWTHGPSILMLSMTLYLVLLARQKPRLIQFASIPLAFSYAVRPSNSIAVLLLTIFVLIQYREYFWRYLLWAMTIAVPFLLFNVAIYDSLLPPYFQPAPDYSHFLEALAGNLISPARGLFVLSPILLFSIGGLILRIRENRWDRLDYFLLAIIFLHWIGISSLPGWWAGHSFGPRYMTDMIPYFMYFLIPVVGQISQLNVRKVALASVGKLAFAAVFYGLIAISFFVHYQGATDSDVWAWNSKPVDIDLQPGRVWDWDDMQFLRGVRN